MVGTEKNMSLKPTDGQRRANRRESLLLGGLTPGIPFAGILSVHIRRPTCYISQAMAAMEENLKRAGLRATGPRLKVLELFEGAEQRHLTADDVYQELISQGEHVGLATVYRVLTQFEGAGLLVRHQLESGKAVFELSRLGDHNHLICLQCGLMKCFTDDQIDRRQQKIAHDNGFEVSEYSLYTYVNCVKSECPHRPALGEVESVSS